MCFFGPTHEEAILSLSWHSVGLSGLLKTSCQQICSSASATGVALLTRTACIGKESESQLLLLLRYA